MFSFNASAALSVDREVVVFKSTEELISVSNSSDVDLLVHYKIYDHNEQEINRNDENNIIIYPLFANIKSNGKEFFRIKKAKPDSFKVVFYVQDMGYGEIKALQNLKKNIVDVFIINYQSKKSKLVFSKEKIKNNCHIEVKNISDTYDQILYFYNTKYNDYSKVKDYILPNQTKNYYFSTEFCKKIRIGTEKLGEFPIFYDY